MHYRMYKLKMKQTESLGFGSRTFLEPMSGEALHLPVIGYPIVLKLDSGTGCFISSPVNKIETGPDITGFRCTTQNSVYELDWEKIE